MNPGGLPAPLRVEELKQGHRSLPRNRKIAEMFFYAGLIEQWGSGTLMIVRECKAAGLPEPDFEEKQGGLWLALRKYLLTEASLRLFGLNERQIQAVKYIRQKGKITNKSYQDLNQITKPSATRDLTDLVTKSVLKMVGKGRNVHYVLIDETR